MSTIEKAGLKITVTSGLIIAALVWGGGIQAKIERVDGVYKTLEAMNGRLSNIEGALGVKKDSRE